MTLLLPPKRYADRRCDRCGGGRERGDVWLVSMAGRLILHCDCADALYEDIGADLRQVHEMAAQAGGPR